MRASLQGPGRVSVHEHFFEPAARPKADSTLMCGISLEVQTHAI
jgi:hypothetical protein